MIATLMLMAVLLAPTFGQTAGCPDVQVIGVRGSGQQGYGEQAGAVVEAVVERVASTGRSVSEAPLDYPAISVSNSFGLVLLTGAYDRSVEAGVDALRFELAETSAACADTDIVLVGYSQGAQVIKLAVAGSVPDVRIVAVALLADPTRDPTQPGVTRLGDASGEHGGSFGTLALPDYLRPITVDVCAQGDGICERGRFRFLAHTLGYLDIAEIAAARLIPFVIDHGIAGPQFR